MAAGRQSFILGVAVWAFWLRGSDYYWDETLGSWQGPYSEAQVVGCVLTYALMVAVLSTRLNPVLVTVGMASGFWVAWNCRRPRPTEPACSWSVPSWWGWLCSSAA